MEAHQPQHHLAERCTIQSSFQYLPAPHKTQNLTALGAVSDEDQGFSAFHLWGRIKEEVSEWDVKPLRQLRCLSQRERATQKVVNTLGTRHSSSQALKRGTKPLCGPLQNRVRHGYVAHLGILAGPGLRAISTGPITGFDRRTSHDRTAMTTSDRFDYADLATFALVPN